MANAKWAIFLIEYLKKKWAKNLFLILCNKNLIIECLSCPAFYK
jgi:hypothetical protein